MPSSVAKISAFFYMFKKQSRLPVRVRTQTGKHERQKVRRITPPAPLKGGIQRKASPLEGEDR